MAGDDVAVVLDPELEDNSLLGRACHRVVFSLAVATNQSSICVLATNHV